jgi:hypothetical protein
LPINRRFILDGFGSLATQSGTVDPDCIMTLAILSEERCEQSIAISPTNTYGFNYGASSLVK